MRAAHFEVIMAYIDFLFEVLKREIAFQRHHFHVYQKLFPGTETQRLLVLNNFLHCYSRKKYSKIKKRKMCN